MIPELEKLFKMTSFYEYSYIHGNSKITKHNSIMSENIIYLKTYINFNFNYFIIKIRRNNYLL